MTIITRFAPSPTGLLHIGGARTALYNYLYAKRNKGIFKLRIEDTDKERSNSKFSEDIFSSMKWLGINWDQDVIYQSKNISYHINLVQRLLKEGKAYRCYCTKEEIEEARDKAKKEKKPYKYNRKWRDFEGKLEIPYVVRIKIPLHKKTILKDKILGEVVIENNELEDFIILRSDNTPTYMLSVVADDKLMEVTDVIRGDDHLTNTFKQLILFSLLDWQPPRYSHIPLIHSQEGSKLSKRHGDLSVKQYKENSFLPAALINYLLRLGWGHGDKEFFSLDEAVSLFSLEGVGKSPAKFDEKKLNHINTFYFKKLNLNELLKIISSNYKTENYNKNLIEQLLLIFQERSENIKDFLNGIEYMLSVKEINLSEPALAIIKNTQKNILDLIITNLKNIENWNSINIESIIKDIAKKENLKLFSIASPIRAAVTGKNHSPSIFKILELLGKENTLKRLKKAF